MPGFSSFQALPDLCSFNSLLFFPDASRSRLFHKSYARGYPPVKFTDGRIKSLSSSGSRMEIADEGCAGLYVRVSQTGNKSFAYKYRRFGKLTRITLGRYPSLSLAEARSQASDLTRRVRSGEDIKTASRASESVESLVEDYIQFVAGHGKRSWQEDRRILEKDFVPRFGGRPAGDVSKRELIAMLDEIAIGRQAGCMANRTLSCLRSFYRWATGEDLIASDPSAGIRKRAREFSRDRALTVSEIGKFWAGLENVHTSQHIKIVLRLILITGKRVTEIAHAQWPEIDDGWWVTPERKSKTFRVSRTPISPLTEQLLNQLRRHSGHQEWLFPSRINDGPIRVDAVSRAVQRIRQDIGIPHWTARDLRRTAATHIGRLGVPPHVVGKLLNHSDGSVAAIYNRHKYDNEQIAAMTLWDAQLREIIGSTVESGLAA